MSIALILIVILSMWMSPASEAGEWSAYESPGQISISNWGTTARIVGAPPDFSELAVVNEDGIHTTSDGNGWDLLEASVPAGSVVTSGGDPAVMLAGDQAECMRGGPGTPLQRSVDSGITWTPVEGNLELRPLAIWGADGLALGSTCAGLEVSVDGGLAWMVLPGIEPGWDVTSFAIAPQEDGSGPIVLVGLTGEGGTSFMRSIDLSDPMAPVVSGDLRMYYAIGGLAGADDTFVLAAMDGAWVSRDAGVTWERSADGLREVVLEEDPAQVGLPMDIDPRTVGLTSVVMLSDGVLLAGSADGLYVGSVNGGAWTRVEGTAGRVDQLAVSSDGSVAAFRADEVVQTVALTTT